MLRVIQKETPVRRIASWMLLFLVAAFIFLIPAKAVETSFTVDIDGEETECELIPYGRSKYNASKATIRVGTKKKEKKDEDEEEENEEGEDAGKDKKKDKDPVTEAPSTEAPSTEAPATEAPATEAPAEQPVTPEGSADVISETRSFWQSIYRNHYGYYTYKG